MGIPLQFYFSPYPSAIWDEGIALSHASYQLLGYLLKHTNFGRDRIWLTNDEIFDGRYSRTIKDFDKGSGIKSKKGLKNAVDQLTSLGWLEVTFDTTDLARTKKIYKLKLNDDTVEDNPSDPTSVSRIPRKSTNSTASVVLGGSVAASPGSSRESRSCIPLVVLGGAVVAPPGDLGVVTADLVHEDIDLLLTLKDLKIQDPERSKKEYKKELTEEEFANGLQPFATTVKSDTLNVQKNEIVDIEATEIKAINLPAERQEKDMLVMVKHSSSYSQASYNLPANQKPTTTTPTEPTKIETSLPKSKTPKASQPKPAVTNMLSMEHSESCTLEVLTAAKKVEIDTPKTSEWQLFLEAIISVFKIHIQTYNSGRDGYGKLGKSVQGYYQAGLRAADVYKLGRCWQQSFMAKNAQSPLLSQFSVLYGQSRDWVEPTADSIVEQPAQKPIHTQFLTRAEKNIKAIQDARVSIFKHYLGEGIRKHNLNPEQVQGLMSNLQGVQ